MSATLGEAHDDLYRSLNVMLEGDAGPVLAVWSNSDDVTYGGPFGGFVSGRDAVVEAFEASAAMVLGGSIEVSDVHMLEGTDVGYSVCIEHGNDHTIDGQPVNLVHRATNIFRKEGGSWRLVHHHTDGSAA